MKAPIRNVVLDRSLEAELVIAAAKADRSVSYIVRAAVREYLDAHRDHPARRHKREELPA